MSTQSPGPSARPDRQAPSGTRKVWAVVGLLLVAGATVPLLVGTYDSESPEVAGFPFFYWYQFLLIPIVSALTFVAFKLSESATERDRQARGITRRQP